jgi:hypothetical protein
MRKRKRQSTTGTNHAEQKNNEPMDEQQHPTINSLPVREQEQAHIIKHQRNRNVKSQ